MDETIKKLEQQDKKLDAIYASAEKTRKYLAFGRLLSPLLRHKGCARLFATSV